MLHDALVAGPSSSSSPAMHRVRSHHRNAAAGSSRQRQAPPPLNQPEYADYYHYQNNHSVLPPHHAHQRWPQNVPHNNPCTPQRPSLNIWPLQTGLAADLVPELDYSSSPNDSPTVAHEHPPSPPPLPMVNVVCDVPLLAPIPLPYTSPTFLQFDLPEDSEGLSPGQPEEITHPGGAQKRRREEESELLLIDTEPPVTSAKKRKIVAEPAVFVDASWDRPRYLGSPYIIPKPAIFDTPYNSEFQYMLAYA